MNYKAIILDYLLRKQSNVCGICGSIFTSISPPTLDHVVPRSLNGIDRLENLQAVHNICNMRKGNKILEAIQDGFLNLDEIDGLDNQVNSYRKFKITDALTKTCGNITLASELLKITYRSLRWYIKKYHILKKYEKVRIIVTKNDIK